MPPADRPPHLISLHDVADWLMDSVNSRVTFHNTTPTAATEIRRGGVRIERSTFGSFGQGFYTSTEPDPFYGVASLRVAVRLHRPLTGHLDDVADYVADVIARLSPRNPEITPSLARRIRRELVDAGYDGLVIYDAGGDSIDYVVALVDGVVRIVAED